MPASSHFIQESAHELTWSDTLLLGFGPMDDTHREFVSLIGAMQAAPVDDLPGLLEALIVHVQAHFAMEDEWMMKTDFPAQACHMNEHAAVLQSVLKTRQRLAEGDIARCRRLAEELADWFPAHADYLDSALAHWLCKRQFGGKPVVLRRNNQRALGSRQ
ncbi:hemerythrin domain-containing protein [Zoogloea sp.]|uniref:bacteriohemerythrin n=1 Tax=Zoogloea sp. TaxID=49181 RepID=UPI0014158CB2|nr:MAG: hemerythrin [Zoogloea sp.]